MMKSLFALNTVVPLAVMRLPISALSLVHR